MVCCVKSEVICGLVTLVYYKYSLSVLRLLFRDLLEAYPKQTKLSDDEIIRNSTDKRLC